MAGKSDFKLPVNESVACQKKASSFYVNVESKDVWCYCSYLSDGIPHQKCTVCIKANILAF